MSYQAKVSLSLSGLNFVIVVKRGQFSARELLSKEEWLAIGEVGGPIAQLDTFAQRVSNCCTKIDAQARGLQNIEAES